MGQQTHGLPPRPLEGYPAYGAVHDVPPARLRDFLYDFGRIADGVFATELEPLEVNPIPEFVPTDEFDDTPILIGEDIRDEEPVTERTSLQILELVQSGDDSKVPELKPRVIEVASTYDSRKFYRIFDPESLGVSVVEMDPSRRHAQAMRTIWEKQDFGAVEKEARNEIGRKLPNVSPHLRFSRVDGVGRRLANYPQSDVYQKLALMPNTNYFVETLNLIEDEKDIIVEAIRKRLKQFVYPWDSIPHLTFALFRPDAKPEQVVAAKEITDVYLAKHPLVVRLGELAFRSKPVRSKRH